MTKFEINAIQSSLFSPELIENSNFVINQQDIAHIDAYHRCLLACPEPHTFLNNNFGISDELIEQCNIGYVDPIAFETEILSHHLLGCFTLPLLNTHSDSGVYGMRHQCQHHIHDAKAYVSYSDVPVFMPFLTGNSALFIDNPFTALALSEMGYTNAVSALGHGITSMALSELAKARVEHLVVFTHAYSNIDEYSEAKVLVRQYGINLCCVGLPFRVDKVGNWDGYQWKLFDKRLTQALNEIGSYNGRYHA